MSYYYLKIIIFWNYIVRILLIYCNSSIHLVFNLHITCLLYTLKIGLCIPSQKRYQMWYCFQISDVSNCFYSIGQYIASNILDAIQKSRRILIVLTRALLESDWCNYELQMALMEEAHTGRDVLLFLLYENLPKHELPRDILFSIQSHTYIEFPHTEIEREPFWNRLADALRG